MDHDLTIKDPGNTGFSQSVSVKHHRQSEKCDLIASSTQVLSGITQLSRLHSMNIACSTWARHTEAGREFYAFIAKETSPAFQDGWKRKSNMHLHNVLNSVPRSIMNVADINQKACGSPRVAHNARVLT